MNETESGCMGEQLGCIPEQQAKPATRGPTGATSLNRLFSAYEHRTGVSLTVHDYTGSLCAVVPPEYFLHDRNPWCRAVKATDRDRCSAFDLTRLQGELSKFPKGGWKCCRAGYLEAFVPIRVSGRVEGALFAGVFHPAGKGIPVDLAENPSPASRRKSFHPVPPTALGETEKQEHLALLSCLSGAIEGACLSHFAGSRFHAGRRDQIEGFFAHHFDKEIALADLCRWMGLNASRTSELVKDLFGKTFPELVNERRLAQATRLLTETSLPVHFIATQCGFSTPEYFYHIFRRAKGLTPLAWRKKKQTPGAKETF